MYQERQFQREDVYKRQDNPEREEENRPSRAGTMRRPRFTIFGALLFVLLMPFRFIGSLTRNILSLIHI